MARDTQNTNIVLGIVAVVFIFIIIILCIVPKEGGQRFTKLEQSARGRDHEGITNTTSTSTSTTTSSTTSTAASTPTTATTSSTASTPTSTTIRSTTSTPTTATTSTASSTPTTATTSSTDSTLTNATTSSTASTPTNATTSSITTDLSSETSPTTIIENSTTSSPSSPETKPTSETTNTTEEATTKNSTDTTITTTTTPTNATTSSITTDLYSETSPTTIIENSTTSSPSSPPETKPTSETTTNTTEETTTKNSTDTAITTTTTNLPHMNNKCELPACVSLASDIRVMMDSAGNVNACEDFYQYACGGVMNKPYIKPINRGAMARKIIKDELDRQNSSDTNSAGGKMKFFYDSCLNSGSQDTRKSWAKLIKDTFDTYQFSDSAMNGTDFNFDLDKTLGYMMKRGFTPFFDIELEVNPDEVESFMISLHPTIPGSPFHNNLARKVCLEEHHSNLPALGNTSYDVTEAYGNFTNCVGTGKGLEARLVRMKDAVVQFELTKSEELLEETLAKTKDFLTDLSEKQPHIPDLIMNLANNDYDDIKHAEDLDNSIIDWVTVLSLFLDEDKSEVSTRKIAMYCERSMNSINGVLKNYYEISKAELNNILVMLWAEWIYTVFVEPVMGSVGEHEYCLNTAISLMEDTASYLYLQAVDPDVKARNEQIDKIAANIKEEGMNKLRNWSLPEPFQAKLETMMKDVIKLDNVKRETATKSMETVSLTGDFLHNTLLLVKHQSTLMKDKLYAGTDEMWRAFARPYDPFGIYNYRLNKIMIPYASQEPFQTLRDVPEYLHYARIGRQISHLMWHGYDTSGIGFELATTSLTGIKSKQNQLKTEYNGAKSYKNPKGLTANYDMTNLTTNEIWADVGSTDLVWQAYLKRNEVKPTSENLVEKQVQNINTRRRRHSVTEPQDFEEKTLPFLDMTPAQLYHLYWAQSYCSDSSDLNMLEVTETRKPPGRERVNFVTKHSEEFKKAFSCTLN